MLESLYADPELIKQFPYLPTLLKSIQNAKPRPKAVAYGDVTLCGHSGCVRSNSRTEGSADSSE